MRKCLSVVLAAIAAVSAGACSPAVEPGRAGGSGSALSGSWEYTIVTIGRADEQYIQYRLNELGQDGWECFFVDKSASGIHYMMKRPERE